ncbi:L-rhamnose mutarotase [Edaphobacter lichenicola]|uniref:L-rhamnose mutarotase n=1 Tax=Tunturiibacter gelidiferens TaxID=3069689 RepID=A0A9X0U361_9BACT|nr:L-rhamnose mutarotase [Edaphobacter lichenicola]
MKRFCLTLSLRPDPELIAEYIEHHRIGRPEIHKSIRDAGVLDISFGRKPLHDHGYDKRFHVRA